MTRSSVSIADHFVADSPVATEFRRLLHRMRKSADSDDLKTILVTSAVLSEGKSVVCSFLGMTAAKQGLKTLLVDCDLRRPTVHKLFALPRANGLVELLTEGAPVKGVIKKTSLDRLDIVTAGRFNSHPGDIFDAAAIASILSGLKFYYDLILVDSPPVVPVSDPMLLASELDGTLMVVKAGTTQREVAERAIKILDSNGKKLLGLVVNNLNESLPYYYHYSHYHYDYSPMSDENSLAEGGGDSPRGKGRRKAQADSNDGAAKDRSIPR